MANQSQHQKEHKKLIKNSKTKYLSFNFCIKWHFEEVKLYNWWCKNCLPKKHFCLKFLECSHEFYRILLLHFLDWLRQAVSQMRNFFWKLKNAILQKIYFFKTLKCFLSCKSSWLTKKIMFEEIIVVGFFKIWNFHNKYFQACST